jgi:hypothetical protein
MTTVTLNESGYDTGMDFEEYCTEAAKHGDNPADYSTDIDDFVFVGFEYAQSDPRWSDSTEGWPENLPLWEYRPE